MFPVYNCVDSSYPQPHLYQNYSVPHYNHPSCSYHGGGFGYPNPMECHGGCNHVYPPNYYYTLRPPCSHLPPPPPSPFNYQGPYPSFVGAYPPYHAPLHYTMEQPRYEFDKDVSGRDRHCCGYTNHACKQKEDKGVTIEPDLRKKESDSLAPANFNNNYPYPFVLAPPECLKSSRSSELEPRIMSGWYPFGMKNDNENGNVKTLESLRPVEDEKGNQNQNNEDKRIQFPFPMFWFPGYENREELKKKNFQDSGTSQKLVEEEPAKLKIIPVNPPQKDDCKEKPVIVQDTDRKGVIERDEKKINMKQKEGNGKNPSNDQALSPRKASKLPPVCLRVDPLPRRKSGTSRSPSPPGVKAKLIQTSDPTAENRTLSGPAEQVPVQDKPRKEIQVGGAEEKVDHSKEDVARNCDQSLGKNVDHDLPNKEGPATSTTDKGECCESENTSEAKGDDTKMEKRTAKREFSTVEACLLIQSFYRGYEVRRWEPLKKLKQIAKVRKQADEVRQRIQALESSSELQKDQKQRVLISETIMSLLLQFDTIQGLHPSVRDIRKAVARELVCLQEKLDSSVSWTAAGEEEKVRNFSDTTLQKASCETALRRECIPVAATEKPNEGEYQVKSEEQLPTEVVKECTESPTGMESKYDKDWMLPSLNMEHEKLSSEVTEHVQKLDEAPKCGLEEYDESIVAVDKEGYPEMEERKESLREEKSCETRTEQDSAAECMESSDVLEAHVTDAARSLDGMRSSELSKGIPDEMASSKPDENQELPVQEVGDERLPLEDPVSLRDLDHNTISDSENQQLALGRDDFPLGEGEDPVHVKEEVKPSKVVDEHQEKTDTTIEQAQTPSEVDQKHNNDGGEINENGVLPLYPLAEANKLEEKPTGESERYEPIELEDSHLDYGTLNPFLTGERADAAEQDMKQMVSLNEEVAVKNHEDEGAEDNKLMDENEKLREMIAKLLQEGKRQLAVISGLNGRVKDLERQLTKRKKMKMRRHRATPAHKKSEKECAM